jgi:glycosyltransferase involved in cell wall biosynthesis
MTRKVRIAQVLTNLHDGGIEKVVFQIATGISPERFETRVYALIEDNPWKQVFEAAGIPVEVIGASNRLRLRDIPRNLRALFRLARLLRRDRIEIVSTHDFFPAVLGRVASLLAGIPHRVTTLHNTYTWFRAPHHLVNRMLAGWTDAVIAVSDAAYEYSRTHDRIPSERYKVIPNGIEPPAALPESTRAEILDEIGIPASAIVVGNVGTHSVRKGQRTLLQAVAMLSEDLPQLHCIVVGSPRSHELEVSTTLHRLAESPALRGRVHFLEDRHDMHRLYRSFDLFCMPSTAEGLSLASIEAMMSGCCCLFSDIAPFLEVARPGEDAMFFPVEDAEALSRCMRELILDAERAEHLRAKARHTALSRFHISAMLESYERLFGEIAHD